MGAKLKNSTGKPDGFIKLFTKRSYVSYIGPSELVNMVIIFMVSNLKNYWSTSVFPRYKETFPSN